MSEMTDFRIDLEAVKALIRWKSLFANEVATRARQLVAKSGRGKYVTLAHYRQAAQAAVQTLSAAIADGKPSNDDKEAA